MAQRRRLEVLQQKNASAEFRGKIAVSLWLGRDPRILLAGATGRSPDEHAVPRPSRFVQADGERRIRVLLRVLSAQDRRDGADPVGGDNRLAPLKPTSSR